MGQPAVVRPCRGAHDRNGSREMAYLLTDCSRASTAAILAGARYRYSRIASATPEKRPNQRAFLSSPLTDSNRRPPPYHAVPQATGRNSWQGSWLVSAVLGPFAFASGCHRLRPLCSMNAPSARRIKVGGAIGALRLLGPDVHLLQPVGSIGLVGEWDRGGILGCPRCLCGGFLFVGGWPNR